MNCQNVIQNNLCLPSQTAQIEVLLGRHWGKATSTERTQNGLRAYPECGDARRPEVTWCACAVCACGPYKPLLFSKDLWQVAPIVSISLETRHRLSDGK